MALPTENPGEPRGLRSCLFNRSALLAFAFVSPFIVIEEGGLIFPSSVFAQLFAFLVPQGSRGAIELQHVSARDCYHGIDLYPERARVSTGMV